MSQLTLLIVDDHPAMVKALCRHLRRVPWLDIVDTAGNGAEAVEACSRLRPDVVVMDYSMPEMDGVEATRLMKHMSNAPYVVVTSHYDDEGHSAHALAAGADAFVSKAEYFMDILPLLKNLAAGRGIATE